MIILKIRDKVNFGKLVVILSNNQTAPEMLESIRVFLNTWRIPNETREPVDFFESEEDIHQFMMEKWNEKLPFGSVREVKHFRDTIREAVEKRKPLKPLFEKYPLQVMTMDEADMITYKAIGEENLYTFLLRIIVLAITDKQWGRLKACPDCKWVFYDQSRNGSKRWCGMYAEGEAGRACGTIAKVKRHRAKRKATSSYIK